MLQMKFPVRFLLLFFLIYSCKKEKTVEDVDKENFTSNKTFTLMSPNETNIRFQNKLEEGLNTNVLMYEYLYNGGGVATGDFNGDDLIDIYFTSNMSNNEFYINQGDLKFKNTTTSSKVSGRPGPWKTGVTVVDINGDSKLDIYLCYSGALPSDKRKNQLFINQGNNEDGIPEFTEEAEKYGLASEGYSNQAYFLDYDNDGDLDVLLLNHSPKSMPVLNEKSTAIYLKKDDPLRGLRLFKQTKGVFEDVTVTSGVNGSALSYGLGLGVSDINNDGWVDFYISNDYTIPDYLYINNGDGTFTDKLKESMGHTSHFSMGNDIADINNDGWQDIFTLDMLPETNRRQKLLLSPDNYEKFNLNIRSGFHYQYMRNMLQLNNGNGTFSEIGQLAGISNTDWSWAPLFADYNNDGWKDLYVTNGYYRDYTNLDFIDYMEEFVQAKGRLKREDVLQIIKEMPSSNITNYMFVNQKGAFFSNETESFGMRHISNSNGAAYADLDNDGDLELIVNNINTPAFIYRNESQKESDRNYLQVKLVGSALNTQGLGAKITIYNKGSLQRLDQMITKGYLSSVSPVLHFGLGNENNIDSLSITWNSGKNQVVYNLKANQVQVLDEKNAVSIQRTKTKIAPIFKEILAPVRHANADVVINDFKRQSLLISQFSHSGPCMTKADVNNDGLEDIIVGGAQNQSTTLFLQNKNGKFRNKKVAIFEEDSIYEDIDIKFFDANNDGNQDVYIASGGYHNLDSQDNNLQDRLYFGDGLGGFSSISKALPEMLVSNGCVAIGDVNNDGYLDIFAGGRVIPGRYPETPKSYLLINDGKGHFSDELSVFNKDLQHFGMLTDALWTDVNEDGKVDLIVVGEWKPLSIFINTGDKLINKTESYFDHPYSGWWNKIETGDFNGDGKVDFIVGNAGTNAQFKASQAQPATMYYKDFDDNGAVDPMLSFYVQGTDYPYLTRGELLGQLAGFKSKYTSYDSYSNATMADVFNQDELKSAKRLEANHMETTLFLSKPDAKFEISPLPIQAQYSSVNAIVVWDINKDGNEDMLLMGNNHHYKLRLGKFDANYGTLLMGNGLGGFEYVEQSLSGLDVRGEVKSTLILNNTLLLGINGEPIKAYKMNR
ncbi:MAG: RNA-binding protein [Flavobacteriaceae bacterium]|nr:MAG: RNA-binding protein [Flavobacteriaceae bacterium]